MNYDFLTVEDYNSIVAELAQGWTDYHSITVSDMNIGDDKTFDFVTVRRLNQENGMEVYRIGVENSLWTGGFYLASYGWVSVEELTYIYVRGANLTSFTIVFELSNDFTYNQPTELEYKMELPVVSAPYYEKVNAKGRVLNTFDHGVEGVRVYYNNNTSYVLTDDYGYYTIPVTKSKPDKQSVKISLYDVPNFGGYGNYYFLVNRLKIELHVTTDYTTLIKDEKQEIVFKFEKNSQITTDELFTDNEIVLLINNKEIPLKSYNNNTFTFEVDLTDYHEDSVNCRVKVKGNEYIEASTTDFTFNCEYYTVTDYENLKEIIENPNGYKTIQIIDNIMGNEIITVNRPIRLIGVDSNNNIIYGDFGQMFEVNSILQLENFTLQSGIVQNKNSEVYINNCEIQYIESYNEIATVIYCNADTDEVAFKTEITNSYICENSDCQIYHCGELTVRNCIFEKFSTGIAFINQNNGECIFDRNTLDFTGDGVMFRIGLNAKINGKQGKDLQNNQLFPVLNNKTIANKISWIVENNNEAYYNDL